MLWFIHPPDKPALVQANPELLMTASETCGWLEIKATINHGFSQSQSAWIFPWWKHSSLKLLFSPPPLFWNPQDTTCHFIKKTEEIGENPLNFLPTYYFHTFPLFFSIKTNKESLLPPKNYHWTKCWTNFAQGLSTADYLHHPWNFSFYFLSHSVQWPVTSISPFHC